MLSLPYDARYLERFATLRHYRVPKVGWAVAVLVVTLLLMLAAGLYFTPWVQTAAGTGRIVELDPAGRVQSVNALVGGRIKRWYVQEGDRVSKGDPILEIEDVDPQLVSRLRAELVARRQQASAARLASETARLDAERQERLFDKGLSSQRDVEVARIKYKELVAKQAAVEAEVQQAETQLARQSTQLVVAPRDGTLLRLLAGDEATLVKSGEAVATFAPVQRQRAAEVFVRGLDAPLVQPGQEVRLTFEGWPAVQFSGWPAVAVGTFPGRVLSVDPVVAQNDRFRVLVVETPVQPWPDERFLRLGGKVRGWVLLGEVRLGYELWRQLNNFPPEPVGVQKAETQQTQNVAFLP